MEADFDQPSCDELPSYNLARNEVIVDENALVVFSPKGSTNTKNSTLRMITVPFIPETVRYRGTRR